MKRGTLSELSRLTGFSKTTISRILSGKADKYRVSDTTQRLVMSIYRLTCENMDEAAQHLRNNSYRTIGLAVPSISNPFFANLSAYIIAEARKYDYSVSIFDTQENGTIELERHEAKESRRHRNSALRWQDTRTGGDAKAHSSHPCRQIFQEVKTALYLNKQF